MNNKNLISVIIGLLIGTLVGVGGARSYMNRQNASTTGATMMTSAPDHKSMTMGAEMQVGSSDITQQMHGSMSEMTASLQGKAGEDFDKAFITGMIEHHQGAINIATIALKNAGHQEIKDLAKNIITAQTTEINQMKQWQQVWFGK